MTDTAWIWILCTISALGAAATFALIELATRRKNRWWEQTEQAARDATDPHADRTTTFDPAKELLRTNDLAHSADVPAMAGAIVALAAITIAPSVIELIFAIAFMVLTIGAAGYAYTMRQQITAPAQKP